MGFLGYNTPFFILKGPYQIASYETNSAHIGLLLGNYESEHPLFTTQSILR